MTIARLKSPIAGYQLITLIFTRNASPISYLDRASRDSQRPFCGHVSLPLSLSLFSTRAQLLHVYVRMYVCIRREVVPFLEQPCVSPHSRPLSRNHIRICDHVTAYRLLISFRQIYTPLSASSSSKRFSKQMFLPRGSSSRWGFREGLNNAA